MWLSTTLVGPVPSADSIRLTIQLVTVYVLNSYLHLATRKAKAVVSRGLITTLLLATIRCFYKLLFCVHDCFSPPYSQVLELLMLRSAIRSSLPFLLVSMMLSAQHLATGSIIDNAASVPPVQRLCYTASEFWPPLLANLRGVAAETKGRGQITSCLELAQQDYCRRQPAAILAT